MMAATPDLTVHVRLVPPGAMLVATVPPELRVDEDTLVHLAERMEVVRVALGMPEGTAVTLTDGVTMGTMTDAELAKVRLVRLFGPMYEAGVARAARQLHTNRHRLSVSGDTDTDAAVWANVAREVLEAYLGPGGR